MTIEEFLSLLALAFATLWTPGPNNIMLASSGATFGFRRTIPHIFGITLGFPFMMLGVGFFLGQIFENNAGVRDLIRWVGAGLMFWIAWKIAASGAISSVRGSPRPLRFYESVAFQWVNPKGWAMIIAVVSQFVAGDNSTASILIVATVFLAIASTSSVFWAGFGAAMTKWLSTSKRLVLFNRTMAALIAVSVFYLFME